jgi:hypothetical protein
MSTSTQLCEILYTESQDSTIINRSTVVQMTAPVLEIMDTPSYSICHSFKAVSRLREKLLYKLWERRRLFYVIYKTGNGSIFIQIIVYISHSLPRNLFL